ncbi:MAG TPA: hypothetical protein VMT55_00765 [Candidatus Sulfotelmatobacter sp.]|nr:hypothetical protein [Candidatus Sulfotelmatobacter sp.]
MGNKVACEDLDYIAGLLRSQIGIAQNLQYSLENDRLDSEAMRNDFQMLSRINRQILNCYEMLKWPMIRDWERSMD